MKETHDSPNPVPPPRSRLDCAQWFHLERQPEAPRFLDREASLEGEGLPSL